MAIHSTVIGNIGNNPELVRSPTGVSYVKLRVAASHKNKDGEVTTWVGGTLFSKRAEALAPYLQKGGKVALSGLLFAREHAGKTYIEIEVSDIELLGSKPKESSLPAADNSDDAPF